MHIYTQDQEQLLGYTHTKLSNLTHAKSPMVNFGTFIPPPPPLLGCTFSYTPGLSPGISYVAAAGPGGAGAGTGEGIRLYSVVSSRRWSLDLSELSSPVPP